ncbi:GMC family oxidoreductase [Actinoplanes sp. NPDC049265]|uniref:GMC family oxidoreductase n=1 Tax=Actinoplanes sp. NPDC049265 TaxID=3363902 RepID=UPI00371D8CF9
MNGPNFVGPGTGRPIPAQVDVLIVGSGPNGAAYARVLSGRHPRARILMVDAGPRLTTIPGRHTRNLTDPEERRRAVLGSQGGDSPGAAAAGTFFVDADAAARNDPGTLAAAAMSTNVGGMGRHWAGATPTPHPTELPSFISAPQWSELFARSRHLLATDPRPLTGAAHWRESLERLAAAFGGVRDMPVARTTAPDGTVTWSGTDTVLGALATERRETFAIAAETVCTELIGKRGRIEAATMRSQVDGSTTTVAAKVFVVAADSLRTPQLLWKSGIRPYALGRYLGDHLVVAGRFTPDHLAEPADPDTLLGAGRTLNNTTGTPSNGLGTVPYDPGDHPVHTQFGQVADRGEGLMMFGCMLAKDAQDSDRVWFHDDRTDRYGMPAMAFDYELTGRDRELRAYAEDCVGRAADALGATGVRTVTQPHGMSLHYLGTVRMGAADDGASVCDSESRVWGHDNLFVAGNGVIPADLSCNPTLTSVAISVRGARAAAATFDSAWRAPLISI